ncbi:MAG: DUF1015 domain-containing protein [Phycisphaeraceae bacterium]|nr:DUF1015 domain-containing protein [Phycisphaeraceae bacterium]
MPVIRPIPAVQYATPKGGDLSALIAPPYDVLDETSKAALLSRSEYNIVAVDLPHLPPKTVGPDEVYVQAGQLLRRWLYVKVLDQRKQSAMFVYRQTFDALGKRHRRMGLFANVRLQPLGEKPADGGGIFPHEQTFSEPKLDRLKLMRTTATQLSPVFGLYGDADRRVARLIEPVCEQPPCLRATTMHDRVQHELWTVDDPAAIAALRDAMRPLDTFIADGHHRYGTTLTYREEQEKARGPLPADHPAQSCLFVMVALQDPGLIVLPTHRALGGMPGFAWNAFTQTCQGKLNLQLVEATSLEALERMLPAAGPHALGLVHKPAGAVAPTMAIATTLGDDPLAGSHAQASPAWRKLDVAIVQHLLVEQICQPRFGGPAGVTWKFPHELSALSKLIDDGTSQLGVIVQATPLQSIADVCAAGELMPQKSTFFYPKLATGLVMNPLS